MANTVLGQVAAAELGPTLCHEHVVFGPPGFTFDQAAARAPSKEDLQRACERLTEATRVGVRTVVDASPPDCGRAPDLLAEVSNKTGLNIICSTGLYARNPLLHFDAMSIDELTELFVSEVIDGIADSGIKAGVIKVATSKDVITPYEEKVVRAAGRAQALTKVPVITHCEAGSMGLAQVDLLVNEGADPRQLMIGHVCDNPNLQELFSLAERGVFLGFDRMGLPGLLDDRVRVGSLFAVLAAALDSSVLLSHDIALIRLGRKPEWYDSVLGSRSLAHSHSELLPRLARAFGEPIADRLLVENPRTLFEPTD